MSGIAALRPVAHAVSQAAADTASGVIAAVRTAASRTGVDFSYLVAQAKVESGLNPDAAASTSSARGLYQFTARTWLDTVRRHGAAHGLGWAADALNTGASAEVKASILSLRTNAEAAALMAGAFARDNGAKLESALGRAASATDLYMAHFLGPSGAARFLKQMASAPRSDAAGLIPAAAAANRGVFYGHDGTPRSLAEVYERFAARIEGGHTNSRLPLTRAATSDPAAPAANVPLARARLAYMLLAELGA
ncbi:transglycosylase SLT domain-containing protein [Sandarakinorhabdus sp.]|uniref:transglycosylase SLT domain-containing protein n=1 Tax=Sandarakinorhabdus sp. TaxID=1916663 RepID=UPI00286E175F|nr:transglycosylase SLT domain-containing protein [Sandarakinorhabdus sp.]